MGSSLDLARLYRKLLTIVTSALLLLGAPGVGSSQIARRRPVDKGPRALGLLQLATSGRAQLVPITIMLDGRFYDAEAYKADPIPFALQPQTVYEGFKSGVSQGLFTITSAGQANGDWMALGSWRTAADLAAEKSRREAANKRLATPPSDEEMGGPPKLKRAPGSSDQGPPPQAKAPKEDTQTPAAKPEESPRAAPTPSADTIEDPNRPVLRRQPLSDNTHEQTKPSPETEPIKGPPVSTFPAISDANGPQTRPYLYSMKPEEEQGFLKKMLAMASEAVRARASQLSAESGSSKSPANLQPQFHDVSIRVFDLSGTNEATLVLTAAAKLPSPKAADLEFMTALVAREDIYGELHKCFNQTTDVKHLDVLPKYDLIDAVDADGDGSAELLFRETWDAGTAYVVYRVIGDQLWPLFEGKPGT